jgi:hypothetical protein
MSLHKEIRPKTLLKSPMAFDRDQDSFNYAQEIAKPFGVLESVLDWCKEELVEEWRWQLIEVSSDHRPGRYIFYFDSERDCLAFTMKWS